MKQELALTNQWNDFLLRQNDPYAMAKYEKLLEWMGDVKNKSALVVGCGGGEFCAMLSIQGAQVHAVDIEKKNTDLALETARKFNAHFTTEVNRLETLAEDRKYDFVIATDVIEHIEDDKIATRKLRKLSKEDGVLVITVPALNFLMGYHDEILGHYRRYSAGSLRALVTQHGFEISKMRYFGFFLIPVAWLISRLLRRPYPVAAAGKAQQEQSSLGALLSLLFKFEKKFNFYLGTSLLLIAKPK